MPRAALYLWGGVGRGKSMLMDLFFGCLAIRRKRRVHFAEFMLEVHQRIAEERKKEAGDPIPPVAAALADEARLLAFDEMMVTNSPDAMILSRLFTALIEAGVTVVDDAQPRAARSLQERPQPRAFPALHRPDRSSGSTCCRSTARSITAATGSGSQETWLVPNGPEATAQLSAAFFRLTDYPPEDRAHVPAEDLDRAGAARSTCPRRSRASRCSASSGCAARRAARPTISRSRGAIHTVILVGIPELGPENRNEAARFVALIDALYEHKVKLLAAADAEPDAALRDGRRPLRVRAHRQPARGNALGRVSGAGARQRNDRPCSLRNESQYRVLTYSPLAVAPTLTNRPNRAPTPPAARRLWRHRSRAHALRSPMARKKIALIGAGNIGGTLAHLAAHEGTRRHRPVRRGRGRAAGQGARSSASAARSRASTRRSPARTITRTSPAPT